MTALRLSALAALLALAACEPSYEDQVATLEKAASSQIGSSADVWLVKLNFFGEWERTALIFGYTDDYDFCREIADLYQERYPSDRYSCRLAN